MLGCLKVQHIMQRKFIYLFFFLNNNNNKIFFCRCNFTESTVVENNVLCGYSVRDKYFAEGVSTFYVGSSNGTDCQVGGLKLQVTFVAGANLLSTSVVSMMVFFFHTFLV